MQITNNLKTVLSPKPADESNLGFGNIFTDHMFLFDYEGEKGWHNARIVPFENVSMPLTNMSFHYGQEVFEGLKAYYTGGGNINLFRARDNFKRLNVSSERMCIPYLDEDDTLSALN